MRQYIRLFIIAMTFIGAEHASAARSWNPVIRSLEKLVEAEPNQDEAAMNRLQGDAFVHFLILTNVKPMHPGLARIVADTSRDWRLRRLCALALYEGTSRRVRDRLLPVIMDSGEHVQVRAAAVFGLSAWAGQDRAVRDAMAKIARDPATPKIILHEIMAVLSGARTEDIELLIQFIQDRESSYSHKAMEALVRSRHPDAPSLVTRYLKDPRLNRGLLSTILSELDGMADYDPARFQSISREVEPEIVRQIEGGFIPIEAISISAKARYKSAVKSLIKLMNDPSQEPMIVWKCAMALGEIGDSCALPHLRMLWGNIPIDPRGDYQLRKLKASLERGRRNQIIPGIENAIQKLERAEPCSTY